MAGSQESSPGVPLGWKEPSHLGCHLLLPRVCQLEAGVRGRNVVDGKVDTQNCRAVCPKSH